MPIKQSKYVDIKSAINTTRTATEKDLIARIFTTSDLVGVDTVIECENLADVGEIFATSSDEYKIASKYFSFINKYARSPRKISFAKNYVDGAKTSVITTEAITFSTVKAITTGTLKIYYDTAPSSADLNSLDFSSCADMSEVTTILNDKLSAFFGDLLGSARFSYEDGKLIFTAGQVGVHTFRFVSGSGSVAEALKINEDSNPIMNIGATAETIDKVFTRSYQTNNNFATFVFLGLTDSTEIATLAGYVAQNYPSEFMMVVPVTSSNYTTIQSATANINGVSLELCGDTEDTGKFNFVMPMSITATTDYNKENGTVNYMYMQDNNMAVVVDDDNSAKTYDQVKVNYYGRTQQAGQKLAFYQNGVLQGNYQDQNIYVNEIWLKDALSTKFLNYMLLTSNWYANKSGQAIGQGLVVDIIDRAKLNGTITTEKEISEADKVYIYNVTADENAWRQIYELGYYLITSISKETINNQETYQFNYTLLYSKGDSIKKVEGQNILI